MTGGSYGHGPNVNETRVMDLWDAGRSMEQIADALGMKRSHVGMIVSMLDVNAPADRQREAAIRAGSIRYAAALAATGKVYS